MRMSRGGVARVGTRKFVFAQPHGITNQICLCRCPTPLSTFQRPQASAPSEFFFSYFFTLIRVYRPPPSASARNYVHNPHLVSFSFSSFVSLIRVRSPRTRNTSARNRVSHPYPVGFSFVLSSFILLIFLYPHPPTSTTIPHPRPQPMHTQRVRTQLRPPSTPSKFLSSFLLSLPSPASTTICVRTQRILTQSRPPPSVSLTVLVYRLHATHLHGHRARTLRHARTPCTPQCSMPALRPTFAVWVRVIPRVQVRVAHLRAAGLPVLLPRVGR